MSDYGPIAMTPIPTVPINTLIDHYDALLLDAYGVLVHRDGPLPGAQELIHTLNQRGKPYFLLSNTAARLPEQAAQRYQGFGLNLAAERIITSGALITAYFAERSLVGERCAVLGPDSSLAYVERAGGIPVPPDQDFRVLLVADQAGFPFLDGVDAALSRAIARLDRGEPLELLLPNPDLIYPKAQGYGITSGAMALMIEAVLRQRFPQMPGLGFVKLGKPEAGMFAEAARRAGSRNLVMIGDQIDTDILGANRYGIASALVAGGVSDPSAAARTAEARPTYLLDSIRPGG